MVSRRRFLGAAAATGLAGVAPSAAAPRGWTYPVERGALVAVLREQAALYDCPLEREEIAGLDRALAEVRPRSHVEAAFCVRCARPYPTAELVDEFVRRRRGGPPELPDHLVLALEGWGLPETQRMLVFREQLETLFRELTGLGPAAALRLHHQIWRRRAGIEELRAALGDRWRGLGAEELQVVFDAIRTYQGSAMRYTWCSTLVDRAQRIGSSARGIP